MVSLPTLTNESLLAAMGNDTDPRAPTPRLANMAKLASGAKAPMAIFGPSSRRAWLIGVG